jgi:hypothetical protein
LLKAKPAALAERLASITNRHHQRLLSSEAQSPSKERNANISPAADARPAPDDCGEDDRTYFGRRPDANERLRLPFQTEFAPCMLEPGRAAFVRISVVKRDAATGRPTRVARRLMFCEGGTA